VYGRIRGDHAWDVATGKKTERRKKQVSCLWSQFCEQLKDQERFKSAAAAFAALQKKASTAQARAAARAAAAAASGDGGPAAEQAAAGAEPAPAAAENAAAAENEEGSTAAADQVESDEDEQGPWAGRSIGSKAAKRACADILTDDRTIGRVASAVETLSDATTQRAAMTAFSRLFKRTKPEGAAFCAHHAKKMLATVGIMVKPHKKAGDATAAAAGDSQKKSTIQVLAPPALGDVADLCAIDDVSATGNATSEEDVTVVADTWSSVSPPVAPPALVEETADASTTPTSAAAAAATAAATTAAARSFPTPAEAPSTTTSGAVPAGTLPFSSLARSTANRKRGRQAQATKRSKEALSMDKEMHTTVDLTSPPHVAPTASAASAAQSGLAAAAAAAAAAVAASRDARRTPPPGSRSRPPPPPPGSSSDDALSDGVGFNGFDGDLLAELERNGERSSSESEHDE